MTKMSNERPPTKVQGESDLESWPNEKLHGEGREHLWRLWDVVLCRLCQERADKAMGTQPKA